MKMNDIVKLIEKLSMSQGFYGRLLSDINYMKLHYPNSYTNLVSLWESKNFETELDVINYLEGGN